jgi:hypothetical protein
MWRLDASGIEAVHKLPKNVRPGFPKAWLWAVRPDFGVVRTYAFLMSAEDGESV